MPMYLGKEVSDEYMKAMIDAYRDGQRDVGGEDAVEDGDQVVIDRLTEEQSVSPRARSAFGLGQMHGAPGAARVRSHDRSDDDAS